MNDPPEVFAPWLKAPESLTLAVRANPSDTPTREGTNADSV
jgi:hypothetical protein